MLHSLRKTHAVPRRKPGPRGESAWTPAVAGAPPEEKIRAVAADTTAPVSQRIAAARIEAEKDARAIKDGEVVTACQSACPADAITFGDLHDQSSQVAKTKKDPRNYILLNELNTQPRTTYLAGLKNQNKEMPDYREHKPIKEEEPETEPAKEGKHEG